MVDIDSGSYNKPGIDAVGAVVQRFMAAHDIPVETLRQQKHGDCLRAAVPWDGPAGNAGGNIVLMGHRDTVFPDGEVVAPAVHHPRRRRLRPGRRRHEGGAGDELLRARRVREVRRRAGAAGRPVHRRRGDRQPGRPRGDRGGGAPRPRRVQLRAGARDRQRGHRPQGRRVHGVPRHRQGGAFGRQLHRRHQRDRGTRAQDPGAARAHRSRSRHHRERRPGQRRAERQHRRALGRRPDRPALRRPAGSRRRDGADRRRSSSTATCRAPRRN